MDHDRAAVAQNLWGTSRSHRTGLLLIDATLWGLLFLAPLFLGGRHPLGNTLYLALCLPACLGLLLCTASGTKLSLPAPVWLVLVGAVCLPVLQLVPLQPTIVEYLSPGIGRFAELRETPLVPVEIGNTLAIASEHTRRSIPSIVLYVTIFLSVIVRTKEVADVRRIVTLIAASGGLLAVVALLQARFGNGLFMWVYDHPSRDPGSVPRGPFQNENHLCNLLAMAMPCLLCLAWIRPRQAKRHRTRFDRTPNRGFSLTSHLAPCSAAIGAVIILCTIAATPSRGGKAIVATTITIFLGLAIFRYLALKFGRDNLKPWLAGAWLLAASGVVAGAVWMSLNIHKLSYWRMKIWLADLRIWREFPLSGVGLGNHRFVYRAYLDEYFAQTFSTSESSWMQVLVEGGLIGVSLQALAVFLVAGALTHAFAKKLPVDRVLMLAAIFAALAGSCLHAFVDFTWHIPACAVPTVVLAALSIRLPRIMDDGSAGRTAATLTLPAWHGRLIPLSLLFILLCFLPVGIREARSEIAWDQYRRLMRSRGAEAHGSPQTIRILQRAAAHDATNTRARSALIRQHLTKWHECIAQPEAAEISRRIVQHSRALARIAPTQGEAFFFAAVVAPTLGLTTEDQRELLQRAALCRRIDGRIAAQFAMLDLVDGNRTQALSTWRKAIELDRGYTEHGLRALLQLFPLPTLVAEFRPSRRTTQVLMKLTSKTASPSERKLLARHMSQCLAAEAMEAEHYTHAIQFMKTAAEYADVSGDLNARIAVAQQRVSLQSSVATRLELFQLLMQQADLAAAREQLELCQQLAPTDRRVRQASVDFLKIETESRLHMR